MTDEPKEEECPTSPTPDTLHECVQEYLDQKRDPNEGHDPDQHGGSPRGPGYEPPILNIAPDGGRAIAPKRTSSRSV